MPLCLHEYVYRHAVREPQRPRSPSMASVRGGAAALALGGLLPGGGPSPCWRRRGAVYARGRATALARGGLRLLRAPEAVPRSTQPTASRTARSVISVRVESARADVAAQARPVFLEEADGAEESLRRTRRRYAASRRCRRGRRAAARKVFIIRNKNLSGVMDK